MSKTRKQEIVDQYIKICRKLNKLASMRECRKLGLSWDVISYNFDGKISNLKDAAMKSAPYLEDMLVPVEVSLGDIEKLRADRVKKSINKTNKTAIETGDVLDYIQQFSENVFKGRISGGKKKKESYNTKSSYFNAF